MRGIFQRICSIGAILVLALGLVQSCASPEKPAIAPISILPPTVTAHVVGTVTSFSFGSSNQMVPGDPGVFTLVLPTPPASTEPWVSAKGTTHAVKFVLYKDWKMGFIGEGMSGPMVQDTGMSNLYLDLVPGTSYRYEINLNTMTYRISPIL